MEKPKVLSGHQLVAKGLTKVDATLPEVGLKEVVPNGSWLEQKQTQAALEARKHLVEVERIEKIGSLSHAEWCDQLNLAEVTQKVGSYWQYYGHNVGKTLYLNPEEALFLIENNSLLLKHNEVTVSLQKAYSLLLNDITLSQYKVYASLSRLGYKVFRHKPTAPHVNTDSTTDEGNQAVENVSGDLINESEDLKNESEDLTVKSEDFSSKADDLEGTSIQKEAPVSSNNKTPKEDDNFEIVASTNKSDDCSKNSEDSINRSEKDCLDSTMSFKIEIDDLVDTVHQEDSCENTNISRVLEINETEELNIDSKANFSIDEEGVIRILNKTQKQIEIELAGSLQTYGVKRPRASSQGEIPVKIKKQNTNSYQMKLQKLRNRKLKPSDPKTVEESFSMVPNIYQKQIVTINVPDEKYLPRNIFLNNTTYVLDLDRIKSKQNPSRSTSGPSEANINVRRIGGFNPETQFNTPNYFDQERNFNQGYSRFPQQFRPYPWRARHPFNYYYQYNMYFHRSFIPGFFSQPRYRFQHNPYLMRQQSPNTNMPPNLNRPPESNQRKRTSTDVKMYHLQAIKSLAMRLRIISLTRQVDTNSIERLVSAFNSKYSENLQLTRDLNIVDKNKPTQVIELDNEGGRKRRRLNEDGDGFDRNLNSIKLLANKLKELNMKNQSASRHRRAFSNVIRKFNKSYNADIYMNDDFEIIDRRFITIDSSSDSDSKPNVPKPKVVRKKKRLRNPFSILKRLKDKNNAGTSQDNDDMSIDKTETLLKYFDKNWLPNTEDFGRPEIYPICLCKSLVLQSREEDLLYEFLRENRRRYKSWVDMKMSFINHLEATNVESQRINIMNNDFMLDFESRVKPLIGPEDYKAGYPVLDKLKIIQTNNQIPDDTSLRIDFDVFNRNVQNFRKTNPPAPHFRIICVDESSGFPLGCEVVALQARYTDNVPIVFAVVGFASVSYLQIKPVHLDEVCVPKDLELNAATVLKE